MPRTKEQYEEMRQKSRAVILDAALHLFVEKGYHATTIGGIAKEAGVAMGLMYHYFESKEVLLTSIMEEHLDDLINSAAEKQDFSKEPDLHSLLAMIDALFEAIRKRSDSWKLIITVMFQPDVSSGARNLIENLLLHQNGLFEAYFSRIGVQHPHEGAKTVSAVIHGAILSFAMSGDAGEFRLIRDHVLEHLLRNGV
jgi:AcrR family transcriptional regulator